MKKPRKKAYKNEYGFFMFSKDILAEIQSLPCDLAGAWCKFLFFVDNQKERGIYEGTIEDFARIFGELNLEKVKFYLDEISRRDIGDVIEVDSDNGIIRMINRRMVKDSFYESKRDATNRKTSKNYYYKNKDKILEKKRQLRASKRGVNNESSDPRSDVVLTRGLTHGLTRFTHGSDPTKPIVNKEEFELSDPVLTPPNCTILKKQAKKDSLSPIENHSKNLSQKSVSKPGVEKNLKTETDKFWLKARVAYQDVHGGRYSYGLSQKTVEKIQDTIFMLDEQFESGSEELLTRWKKCLVDPDENLIQHQYRIEWFLPIHQKYDSNWEVRAEEIRQQIRNKQEQVKQEPDAFKKWSERKGKEKR